jgi:hypothetical protein
VIRAALRRLLVIVLVGLGGVAAISAALGALAGKSVPHALALGYYIAGAGCLVLSFAFGSRGPTRAEQTEDDEDVGQFHPLGVFGVPRGGRVGRRQRRKATPEERREARLASVGLFAFGLFLVLLGAAIDPGHRVF